MSAAVAGVDGCRGGWICVLKDMAPPYRERAILASCFEDVLNHADEAAIIAIDIPIGLPERVQGSGRECDAAVRIMFGKRTSAVFLVPARSAFTETEYRRACAVAMEHSDPARQISRQMFNLFPKIREVDLVMTPALQSRVYECHPEAAFWAMNGQRPLSEPKKLRNRVHPGGLDQRRMLLMAHGFGDEFLRRTKIAAACAGRDDFLDACACAWTAGRIYRKEAIRFPMSPPVDAKGLRMEILA